MNSNIIYNGADKNQENSRLLSAKRRIENLENMSGLGRDDSITDDDDACFELNERIRQRLRQEGYEIPSDTYKEDNFFRNRQRDTEETIKQAQQQSETKYETTSDTAFDPAAPLDIWGDSFKLPVLTRDMVPEVIADYAWDEAQRIGVDPACVAIPALAICAAGLHDDIKIQPMRHNTRWTERACLWLGFVAPPSARKTPALNSAREPMKHVEELWRRQDATEMAKYLEAMDDYKIAKKEAGKNGDELPELPVKPPLRRLYTSNFTMETLSDILIDNPRGILIFNDELTGFIAGLDAYKSSKGKDRSLALELFNGGDQPVDRKNKYDFVENWSASVVGGIQDEKLKEIAPSLGVDGLLQRFLLFRAGNAGPGEDRKPNMDAIQDYLNMFQTLVQQHYHEPIKMAEEAHKWREEVFGDSDIFAIDQSLSAEFRTHMGKLRGIFPRLVLTLHAIKSSVNRQPIGLVVSEETAKQAHDLITQFFIPHELALYGDLFNNSNQVGQDMRWIAGWMLSHEIQAVRERDVYRAKSEFLDDRRRLSNALYGLVTMNWLNEPIKENGSLIFPVNPKVHTIFAERADTERTQRKANRDATIARRSKYKLVDPE